MTNTLNLCRAYKRITVAPTQWNFPIYCPAIAKVEVDVTKIVIHPKYDKATKVSKDQLATQMTIKTYTYLYVYSKTTWLCSSSRLLSKAWERPSSAQILTRMFAKCSRPPRCLQHKRQFPNQASKFFPADGGRTVRQLLIPTSRIHHCKLLSLRCTASGNGKVMLNMKLTGVEKDKCKAPGAANIDAATQFCAVTPEKGFCLVRNFINIVNYYEILISYLITNCSLITSAFQLSNWTVKVKALLSQWPAPLRQPVANKLMLSIPTSSVTSTGSRPTFKIEIFTCFSTDIIFPLYVDKWCMPRFFDNWQLWINHPKASQDHNNKLIWFELARIFPEWTVERCYWWS